MLVYKDKLTNSIMTNKIIYNLSLIPGVLEQNLSNNKYYSINKCITKSNEQYTIVKYNKEILSLDLIDTYGLLRCVVFSGPKVVSFAPQKSIPFDIFMNKYRFNESVLLVEEFIEGIMINVFFDPSYGVAGCWQIATRNAVGGEITIYKWTKKTVNTMFLEACIYNNFNIQSLNPRYCYSFVLQHPDYKVVVPIKFPALYLTNVYEIQQNNNNVIVYEDNPNDLRLDRIPGIKYPNRYDFHSYAELIDNFSSGNNSYDIMGLIIKNCSTGERSKIRNPVYEEIKYLKGKEPKMMYQYLCLRRSGKLPLYLKYHPESKDIMSKCRERLHMFTENLHQNYMMYYVKKMKTIDNISNQYKTHMRNLHEHYINDLMPNKLCVNNREVIKYVNNLHPSILMYCLNYNMRKRFIDEKRIQYSK